jgi:hypothetical protein
MDRYLEGYIRHSSLPRFLITDILGPLKYLLIYYNIFLIHGACVAKDGKGVLIRGFPKRGKSTLAISLLRSGYKFLGDEDLQLEKVNSRIFAFTLLRDAKLPKKSIKHFPELRYLLASKEQEHRFLVEDVYPHSIISKVSPQLVIFPEFRQKGGVQVKELSQTEAMIYLIQERYVPLGSIKVERKYFDLLSLLVKQTRAYLIYYTDRDIVTIPSIIEHLLEHY